MIGDLTSVASAIEVTGQSRGRRAYWVLQGLVIVHVSGEETDGRFCLVEWLQPPDDMTPLHRHRYDSQTQYVVEGELTVYLPGVSHVLRSGECFRTPPGVAHTERVTADVPTRTLDVNSPAGLDRFFVAIGRPAESITLPPALTSPPDMDALIATAAKHGVDVLGPPGAMP